MSVQEEDFYLTLLCRNQKGVLVPPRHGRGGTSEPGAK